MKEKYTRFDAVDHLKTAKDCALYLQAALEEAPEDSAYIAAVLGDIARAKGMSSIARKTGLTRQALYQALSNKGNPEFSTVMKVISALGIKLVARVA